MKTILKKTSCKKLELPNIDLVVKNSLKLLGYQIKR